MLKYFFGTAFLLSTFYSIAQDQSFTNKIEAQGINDQMNQQSNTAIGGDAWDKTFNNLNHPLAITGGILTLGGAGVYIAGSTKTSNHNYQPNNTTQYVGIGLFTVGAVMFAIFSTERDGNAPKRKKKKTYNSADWEVPQ